MFKSILFTGGLILSVMFAASAQTQTKKQTTKTSTYSTKKSASEAKPAKIREASAAEQPAKKSYQAPDIKVKKKRVIQQEAPLAKPVDKPVPNIAVD